MSLNKAFFSSIKQEEMLKLIKFEQIIIDFNKFHSISRIEEKGFVLFLRKYEGNIQTIRLSKNFIKLNRRVVIFHFKLCLLQVDLDNLPRPEQQNKFLKKVLLNKIKKCEIKCLRFEKSFWAGLGSLKNIFETKFEIKTTIKNKYEIDSIGLEVGKKEFFSFVENIKIYTEYDESNVIVSDFQLQVQPKTNIFYSKVERSNCQLFLFDRFCISRTPKQKTLRKQIPFIFE